MKDNVFRYYRNLLVKLQVPYLVWSICVLGVFFFSSGEVKDPAYLVLGRSFLYFLPIPVIAWLVLLQKMIALRRKEKANRDITIGTIEQNLKSLSSALTFFQLIFILLLMATIVVALTLKSGFAITMISVTIQWFILTVVHFSEHYYTTNAVREMKQRK